MEQIQQSKLLNYNSEAHTVLSANLKVLARDPFISSVGKQVITWE